MQPSAEPCDSPGRRERTPPRHAAVWVWLDGERWPADVHAWYRLADGRRAVWLQRRDVDPSRPGLWEAYVYNPATIQQRHDDGSGDAKGPLGGGPVDR